MKTFLRELVVCLVFFMVSTTLRADWNEGGPHKMHHPQLPDANGWDVFCWPSQKIADDFLCREDGPITNIHLWVSWWNDQIGVITSIHLSIHSDIPMGPAGYSIPNNPPLWTVDITKDFSVRWYGEGQQGWLEPPDYFQPVNHTNIWQINITNIPDPFIQTSGTVYWLDVGIGTMGGFVGWKTSTNHWNDDAVFETTMFPWSWGELTNPMPPFESLDMAFVIDGGEPPEPVAKPECPKWIQPPDCDIGVDIESWAMQSGGAGTPIVADDWLCDGRPITAIRWWGSYIGWQTNTDESLPPPAGQRPVAFLVTWYTDVPSNAFGYSEPGGVITSNVYPLAPFQSNWTGWVVEDTYCVSRLTFIDTNVYEHEYSYYLQLTNDWNEKEPRVYWLSVQAVYIAMPEYRWGWKTTPVVWNWNDDAVIFMGAQAWTNITYPPFGWGYVTNHPYKGQSVDMSFELLTDICPARCKKWQQPPDMITGQDMPTWTIGTNIGPFLRADDFVSDGRPITDIHWWGSYLEWWHDYSFSETNPCPVPGGANRPIGFTLSWHEHDGANCMPGALITNLFVAISNCHETYYGSVTQFWRPGLFEHEFQYYADFLDEGVDRSWYETNGVHYWLNIQAVFSTNYSPGMSPHGGWGWKIAPNTQECLSAVSYDGGGSWRNDVVDTNVPPIHPRGSDNFDLAFELTTTNVPWQSNTLVLVGFTNMGVAIVYSNAYLWTTGQCGCGKQVLQTSTNLLTGESAWADVFTNPLPRQVNYWTNSPLTNLLFYRVKQVN